MESGVALLTHEPTLFVIVSTLFGLLIGSFLNVVILRLPERMEHEWRQQCCELLATPSNGDSEPPGLVFERSFCPHCNSRIAAWHNIPLLSYIVLKGRCADCGEPISAQYPLVEALTALLLAFLAWHYGPTTQFLATALLTCSLVTLAVIDIRTQLLPDQITLPLVWLGLIFSLGGLFVTPTQSIVGAVSGYLSLWIVFQLFRILTGKEGMGFGDFKLLAVFGAWFGWQLLPVTILLSSLVGAIVGVGMILLGGHDRKVPIPFGPYLAIAGWIAMVWGDQIISGYLNFAGIG